MRFLPAGPHTLLVEVTELSEVLGLCNEVERHRHEPVLAGIIDIVPGALTVLFDGVESPRLLAEEISSWSIPPYTARTATTVDIPCIYDGEDLALVAELWGLTVNEAILLHSSATYLVGFCGFVPGFAYMTGLAERWSTPRKASPRAKVPTGSVALAGTYTGIYPRTSPGGWQLIGHTDVTLWDSNRQPPALLAPGMAVRFIPMQAS